VTSQKEYNPAAQKRDAQALSVVVTSTVSCLLWLEFLGQLIL